MKLIYLNTNGVYSHKIVFDGIYEAFQQIKIENSDFDFIVHNINQQDDGTIEKYNPDFIFVSTPLAANYRALKKYKHRRVIIYETEGLYECRNTVDNISYTDYFVTVDKKAIEYFKKFNTKEDCQFYHMPLGFSPDVYKFQNVKEDYKSDVVLAGAIFDRRRKVIDDLYDLQTQITFRVISPTDWVGRIIRPQAIQYLHKTHVDVKELAKYYSGSKIILCVNRDFYPANNSNLRSTTPGRVFQEAACRRMVMVDNTRPELFEYFEDGKEIVSFDPDKPEELREKILYYLNRDEEREAIAHNGYVRTMKENTWKHRIENLLNFIKENE